MPGRALLNDVNLHLIHFYRCLRRGLIARIPMENSEQLYYRHRLRFNELIALDDDGDESAALFYYLNRTGYNGLCRFNKCGKFNVPFGCYTKINYLRDFSDYVGVLRKWEFMSNDFESVPLKVDDFIYADPPYDVEFRSYTKDGFAWEDQVRTAEWLSHHRGPVILVNMATDRIRKVYRSLGYQLKFLEAPRMISCTGNRTPVKEVLALRNI